MLLSVIDHPWHRQSFINEIFERQNWSGPSSVGRSPCGAPRGRCYPSRKGPREPADDGRDLKESCTAHLAIGAAPRGGDRASPLNDNALVGLVGS